MNARISSWLVVGNILMVGGHLAPTPLVAGELTYVVRPTVAGISLESDNNSAIVSVRIPGFSGKPDLQVIHSEGRPDRLVLDFHGVDCGRIPKANLAKISHPLVVKARLSQNAVEPESITRFVLELVPGVNAVVSATQTGMVDISMTAGSGKTNASLSDTFSRGPNAPMIASYTRSAAKEIVPVDSPVLNVETQAYVNPALEVETDERAVISLLSTASVEQLPQIGSPYVGLPSLGPIPIAPIAVTRVQESNVSVAPMVSTPKPIAARNIGDMETGFHGERISIDVQNADLKTICLLLADAGGLNLVMDPDVQSTGWVYSFKDTPWDKILDLVVKNAGLGKEISDGIIRIAKVEKLKKEEDDRKALDEAKALAGNLITVTRGLSYAKVDDAQKIIVNMKSERGKIFTDARTNTMILTDLPRYVEAMQQLLDQLDIKVPQVQIDARIVEANRGWEKAFGVSWPQQNTGNANLTVNGQNATWGAENGPSWNSINNRPDPNNPNANRFNAAFSPGRQTVTDIPAAAGELWVSFLTNRISLNAIIQALEKNNQIKVVSEPKLTVQNNKTGLIDDGARVPYQANQSGIAGGAITVQFVEAKLKLEVTPQITNDGTILLDVSISKDHPDFGQQVNGTPTILSKTVNTTVLVHDGGTAVLGGVFTNTNDSGSVGVPYLSKLPGIGWMFRNKTSNDKTTEMLVMISPKIIDY